MKYYGKIGFVDQIETKPGVWEEQVTERDYYGNILSVSKRWENTDHLNDNLNISNRISIVADQYAYSHFHTMRYISIYGSKWLVNTVEVKPPRLILSVGGVYNGE